MGLGWVVIWDYADKLGEEREYGIKWVWCDGGGVGILSGIGGGFEYGMGYFLVWGVCGVCVF